MQIALQSTSSIAIEDVTWSPKEDDEIGKRTIGSALSMDVGGDREEM